MDEARPTGAATAALDRILRPPLAQQVADRIVEAVAAGAIRPGQRVTDSDIAGRFGVSRNPVREAMKILEAVAEEEPDDGVLRLPSLPRAERPQKDGFPIGKFLFALLLLAGLGAGGFFAYQKFVAPRNATTSQPAK